MFIVTCPNCSRPSPVSLAAAQSIACEACGFTGAPSEGVAEQLRAAAAMVKGIDANARQLSGIQRRAASASGCLGALVIGGFILLMIPAVIFAGIGLWLLTTGEASALMTLSVLAMFFLPLFILLVVGVPMILALRKARTRLRRAASAEPPEREGGAARCRLCGAELMSSSEAVVRCDFCETDNVVDPETLKTLGRAHQTEVDGLRESIESRARQVRSASLQASLAFLVVSVLAPLAVVVLFVVSAFVLSSIEQPANESYRYALVPTEQGTCVARVYEHATEGWVLNFGTTPPVGFSSISTRPTLDGLEVLSTGDLVGRRLVGRTADGERVTGIAERAHSDALGADNALVVNGHSLSVSGMCLE